VNVDEVVGGLLSVMAELIAFYPDRNDRRRRVKEALTSLPGMVSTCRTEGRYPGGIGTMKAEHRH
jgi:hypothetical protein